MRSLSHHDIFFQSHFSFSRSRNQTEGRLVDRSRVFNLLDSVEICCNFWDATKNLIGNNLVPTDGLFPYLGADCCENDFLRDLQNNAEKTSDSLSMESNERKRKKMMFTFRCITPIRLKEWKKTTATACSQNVTEVKSYANRNNTSLFGYWSRSVNELRTRLSFNNDGDFSAR